MSSSDGWSPDAYGRFTDQRATPFDDLLALMSPAPGGTLLDLGCGTGQLTARAHRALEMNATLGLDNSPSMLAQVPLVDGVTFAVADLHDQLPRRTFDRVISNSVLNWLPNHRAYFPRLLALVSPGGQLAVQMPWHADTAFWTCAEATAERFTDELEGFVSRSFIEPISTYAEMLARDPRVASMKVGMWVYPLLEKSVDGLLSFAQGGMLSAYRARLSPESFERFCECYREELLRAYGKGPVFFAFKRVFIFASLAQ